MASYVILKKKQEDEKCVIYYFGPNDEKMGEIKLDKERQMFVELLPVPEVDNPGFYFDRAAQRMTRCLVKENGEFVDCMTFCS